MRTYREFIKESVRDKMTPKSESDIDDAYDKIAGEIADILINIYDYDDYLDAYDWAIEHQKLIMDMIGDEGDYNLEKIIYTILYGYEGAQTTH